MRAVSKIRVLLVDDHRLFREGMVSLLRAQPDFEVVGEAGDGVEALVIARRLRPDLVLMDVSMPGMDGVEAAARLAEELPETVVVMLTVREDDESLFNAIRAGAQGYLLKTIASEELVHLLRGTLRGEAAMTPALGARILDEFRRMGQALPDGEPPPDAALTFREQDVLRLVAQGLTDQQIADELTISVHTVKSHMRSILRKLHLQHRYEAAQYALRRRLIRPDDDRI